MNAIFIFNKKQLTHVHIQKKQKKTFLFFNFLKTSSNNRALFDHL